MSKSSITIEFSHIEKRPIVVEEEIKREKIKVCVVDDNRELVGLLEEYISAQEDMEVIGVAHNGQDCLGMLESVDPDILILDIIMPHLDGLGVLEKLREVKRGAMPNVIMLTAFGQEDVTKKQLIWVRLILS